MGGGLRSQPLARHMALFFCDLSCLPHASVLALCVVASDKLYWRWCLCNSMYGHLFITMSFLLTCVPSTLPCQHRSLIYTQWCVDKYTTMDIASLLFTLPVYLLELHSPITLPSERCSCARTHTIIILGWCKSSRRQAFAHRQWFLIVLLSACVQRRCHPYRSIRAWEAKS